MGWVCLFIVLAERSCVSNQYNILKDDSIWICLAREPTEWFDDH